MMIIRNRYVTETELKRVEEQLYNLKEYVFHLTKDFMELQKELDQYKASMSLAITNATKQIEEQLKSQKKETK